ncbi:MAG: alpha/beta hydrolase [Deltaproteobacteria bacterium]|nr:alpha/beta hydrolase [Deltaproteobacteria bacterium]
MDNPKFVDVGGIKTRYFESGKGEDLVLVHGGKFGTFYNAYHWSLNFDELSRYFHVIAFDKIGMGFTDNPKTDADYTMSAMIEHTRGFLRALGIKNAIIAGHSRGALPAARMAVDHPEWIKALIIFDSNTLPAEDPNTPKDFYTKLEVGAPPVPNREFVCREPIANSYSKAHIAEDFIQEMLAISRLPKLLEAREKMEHLLDALFLPDVRKKKYETLDLIKAGGLKAPTLIIWGANDESSPINLGIDLLQLVGAVVDRTQFHAFNHAAHYVFREHPREVNELIISFVKNL